MTTSRSSRLPFVVLVAIAGLRLFTFTPAFAQSVTTGKPTYTPGGE